MIVRRVLSIGLLGRLLAIFLLIVGIEFVGSAWLYERSSRALIRDDEAHRLAEHLMIARTLLDGQPSAARPAMAHRLTTNRYAIGWTGGGALPMVGGAELADMRGKVLRWEPTLTAGDLRMGLVAAGRVPRIVGAMRLSDGSWVRFGAAAPGSGDGLTLHRIVIALLPAALLLLVGVFLFRHTLRPMGMLARAAQRIGNGKSVTLPESGPREVRRVIHAFNAMQTRIHQLISERTQALAAVGHDLRTPLARMKLRSEGIADSATRRAFAIDVTEMEEMVTSLLAFLGGEDDPEKPVLSDIAVLAATLVDDATDHGRAATYAGPDHLEAVVRTLSIKRALGNLIENAIHYGHVAHVSVLEEDDRIVLRVEDEGPGIPEDQLESVTRPFSRLDFARARNTKGLGLGLAIVTKAAALNNGALILANRPEGGVRAELRLPRD
ncbi:ATP-binding protein [Sphingomonas nostoxanthinifaciens]|uniref:ATP-binding protein n=1 Tax=Sphingomonas nostoxanthinifaciens TaxID=2872652 RepID=UPI001CC1D541|nr:ATP-binding protein [Sphingomonas nostoxanthinifaciens]UAK25089.1 HAMP domain-containing protein [Sphingomonas nostoxanthinifaciens]